MIELYTASTTNGHKASCTLEELGLPYEVHAVDLSSGEQRNEAYLDDEEATKTFTENAGKIVQR